MNELLTCYQYLKEHDMLLLYEAYRNGEELPFDWASDNKYGGHMTAEKLIYTFYLTNPKPVKEQKWYILSNVLTWHILDSNECKEKFRWKNDYVPACKGKTFWV